MARKDVDLVFRAKNQASKAFETITDALKTLSAASEDVGSAVGKTDSVLSRLGTSLGTLDKAFRGLSAADAVAKQVNSAREAIGRMEGTLSSAADEAARVKAELDKVTAANAATAEQTRETAAALEREEAALKGLKTAQATATTELNAAVSARNKMVAADERLTASMTAQEARIVRAAARYGDLAAKMLATAEPSERLKAAVTKAAEALQEQESKLAGLANEHADNRDAMDGAALAVAELETRLKAATVATTEQASRIGVLKAQHTALKDVVRVGASAQRDLGRQWEAASEAVATSTAALEKSRADLSGVEGSAEQAAAALKELGSAAAGALRKSLDQQAASADRAQTAYAAARAEFVQLAAAMKTAEAPTAEMAAEFERARVKAIAFRQEAAIQRGAVAQLGTALDAAGTDVQQLATAQETFVQVQREVAQAVGSVRTQAGPTIQTYTLLERAAKLAATSERDLARATRDAGRAAGDSDGQVKTLSDALRQLYGHSRQAMSWMQRLRGEVLAFAAAYGGIQGVVQGIGNVVSAFTTMEAASTRLSVAFEGDMALAGQELDFVRRTADRLGISIGTLATEYSKFAIATQGTNLAGENTRKIFTAVAEAGVVNRASLDDMKGIFNALTQIISKGSVQMEELRQQLGDRLPGALQIMADGLGVGTDELIKMMEQGQVSSEALIGFSEALAEKYGPGLAKALTSTNVAIGRLANAAFQALVKIGESGFIERFNEFVNALASKLQSAQAESIFDRIGAALSILLDVLQAFIDNIDVLSIALGALVGIKAYQFFATLAAAVFGAEGSLVRLRATTVATAATFRTTAASVGLMTAGITGLRAAMTALMSSTGIGLLITAIGAGIGYWMTSTDAATEAMVRHRENVDKTKNSYDAAGRSVDTWRKKVASVSVTETTRTLTDLRKALADAFNPKQFAIQDYDLAFPGLIEFKKQVQAMAKEVVAGNKPIAEFIEYLDKMAQENPGTMIAFFAEQWIKVARSSEEAATGIRENELILKALTGTTEEAKEALDALVGATEDVGGAMDSSKAPISRFNDAILELQKNVPELAAEIDKLNKLAEVDRQFNIAMSTAGNDAARDRAIAARDQARQAILSEADRKVFQEIAGNTGVTAEMFQLIYGEEDFRPKAYDDGYGTMTIGYGSTRINGRAVQAGDVVTQRQAMEQAMADLAKIVAQIEAMVKVPLSDGQMNALVSYAYNAGIGSLKRDGILQPLNRGDYAGAEAAIRNGVDTSKGVFVQGLRNRREREADLFASGNDSPEVLAEKVRLEEERAEKIAEQNAATKERLADGQHEIEQETLKAAGKERQAVIEDAIKAAKEENKNITEQELAQIADQAGKLYDIQHAQDAINAKKKEAEAAEARVNELLEIRSQLSEQVPLLQQEGNTEGVAQTKAAIEQINTQLREAITNAIQMWQAIGGSGADVAIAKLKTLELQSKQTTNDMVLDWNEVARMFGNGLVNAFNTFARAVAEGKSASEAAKEAFLQFASDFLIQIGQMIIKAIIFKALAAVFPGLNLAAGHTGGVVGSKRIGGGNQTRRVSPLAFMGAMRMHGGGVAGLRPNEVPAILLEGEEVLKRSDPRNVLNGGLTPETSSQQPQGSGMKIVNAFDTASFLDAALASQVGERTFLNFVKANPNAVKAALGIS